MVNNNQQPGQSQNRNQENRSQSQTNQNQPLRETPDVQGDVSKNAQNSQTSKTSQGSSWDQNQNQSQKGTSSKDMSGKR